MRLWRISNYTDLSGVGGLNYSARWHTSGKPVVYTAEHPAGALAEFLVHLEPDNIPVAFQLLTIEVDDGVALDLVDVQDLPPGWASDEAITRRIGDRWLAGGTSALLRVPSVLVPDAANVLINPRHPGMAHVRAVKAEQVPLDHRLR